MSFVFVIQLGLAAAAVLWGMVRLHALLIRTALDAQSFLEALAEAIEVGEGEARKLAVVAPHAAIARLAFAELGSDGDSGEESELLYAGLKREAVVGITSMRTLGRMASPVAFIGVIVEMGLALQGGRGLSALQRGLPERLAIQQAATEVVLGLCTSLFCFFVASQLRRGAQARMAELKLTRDVIEAARQARAET